VVKKPEYKFTEQTQIDLSRLTFAGILILIRENTRMEIEESMNLFFPKNV
jgi:hypothetical protein